MAVKKLKSNITQKNNSIFNPRWWLAIVLVLFVAAIGIVIVRFSRANSDNQPAPKGPIYWIGDSLSTNMVVYGGLVSKLQANGFSPAFVNQNPGRSITAGGFNNQSALAAVDADNKNICPNTTNADPAVIAYCKAHNNLYNPIKDAKTIVLFIGTNPEGSADSFTDLQKQLISKLRTINPNAKFVWGDIASPGNKVLATNDEALNFERLFHPQATRADLAATFDTGRQRITNNLYRVYLNSVALNYSIISQYKFLWGESANINQLLQKTSIKDPNGYLGDDGVHYLPAGAAKLADYVVVVLKNGTFNTTSSLPIPVNLAEPLKISLSDPPQYIIENQAGISQANCDKQNGFKQNANFKGCKLTATSPITLKANPNYATNAQSLLFPNKSLNVCVSSITIDKSQPITISFMLGGVVVDTVSAIHNNSETACGNSSKPISEVDTITLSSPVMTYVTTMTIAAVAQ